MTTRSSLSVLSALEVCSHHSGDTTMQSFPGHRDEDLPSEILSLFSSLGEPIP